MMPSSFRSPPIPARAALFALVSILLAAPRPSVAQAPLVAELELRVEQLRERGSLVIANETIRLVPMLAELYEARSFAPLWSEPRLAAELARAIRGVESDGLAPAAYHSIGIAALAAEPPSPAVLADLDLLRSDALYRLVRDLRYGRVAAEPGVAARDVPQSAADAGALVYVRRILASGRVYDGVAAVRPSHFTYRGLVAALAELRHVGAAGGWDAIAAGPTLRLGDSDPRVAHLRARLAVGGDLPAALVAGGSVFDAPLEAALERFQHRHALNDDGVLGPATLAELNVPVEQRVEQVRVNLERARWLTHDLADEFVAVNIAGAMVYLVRNRDVVLETRAIVGRTVTRTPIFRATMRYIDLNPTWTVPPGIVHEILAEIRRDPSYLRRMNMRVLDRGGRTIDVAATTLARYSAASLPYVFRQEPGPLNPLGRIKFVFPNSHNVYLHDTPARNLFDREERTFSHGCIRVREPLHLAELILSDPVRWNRASLEAAIATGATRTIPLASPLPVLVLYWTAAADLHGELHFYRDVYGRDAAILRALDAR